ncbi:MAG: tetratricopeptide repeat protein [Myxococcales bacterium]|nr:tetratricopeptide repeat protein [Myxococcales bacterium]
MRRIDALFEPWMHREAVSLLLGAALLASACTTSGGARSAQVELQESGFTITEDVRVGFGVRADFEDAVRLLKEEQYEDAIALLVKIAEAEPELTTAHIDLGIAYRAVGDLERAEASLERALALNPRHPVAYNELGIVYRKTGRFEQARESYENALAIHPDFHFARRNLAILCDVYLRDLRCALEHYELYAQAVPEDEAAAMWIADLRNRVGE